MIDMICDLIETQINKKFVRGSTDAYCMPVILISYNDDELRITGSFNNGFKWAIYTAALPPVHQDKVIDMIVALARESLK